MLLNVKLLINNSFFNFYISLSGIYRNSLSIKVKHYTWDQLFLIYIFYKPLFHKKQALKKDNFYNSNQLKSSKTTHNHPKLSSTSRKLSETTQSYLKLPKISYNLSYTTRVPAFSLRDKPQVFLLLILKINS